MEKYLFLNNIRGLNYHHLVYGSNIATSSSLDRLRWVGFCQYSGSDSEASSSSQTASTVAAEDVDTDLEEL